MVEIFRDEMVITILMLGFLVISVLIRVFLGAVYQGMIHETDNMAATNNRLLKQCKVKFANCYQLNQGVSNIPVFVDKFLNRLSVGPLSFETLYHLSGQTMLLSVVTAGVGICKSIADGRMLGEILPFYIASFIGLYLYFSVSTVVDIKGKRRVLKVNLVDYLENHLSARIQVTAQDMDMLYGKNDNRGRRQRLTGGYDKNVIELMPIGREELQQESWSEASANSGELRRLGNQGRMNMEGRTNHERPIYVAPGKGMERMEAADTFGAMDKVFLQEDSSRVTTEELEALLKELLLV